LESPVPSPLPVPVNFPSLNVFRYGGFSIFEINQPVETTIPGGLMATCPPADPVCSVPPNAD
jgi:hypothetical protein